jgi:hypothetical protein
LPHLFGVALKVKADALLEPEDVGNQGRALLVNLVLAQQPEQAISRISSRPTAP